MIQPMLHILNGNSLFLCKFLYIFALFFYWYCKKCPLMVAICHRKSWRQKYRTKEIHFCQIFDTSNSFCDGSKCTNQYQKSPVIERELHTLTQFLMTFCVHLNKKEFFFSKIVCLITMYLTISLLGKSLGLSCNCNYNYILELK